MAEEAQPQPQPAPAPTQSRDWSVAPKVGASLAGVYAGQLIIGLLSDLPMHLTLSPMTQGALIGLAAFAAGHLFPDSQ